MVENVMFGTLTIRRVDTGALYVLANGTLSIGRDPSNDIHIDDRDVSRQHAVLETQNGTTILIDRNSTNGTLLNNWRITRPEPLKAGDQIIIADTRFEVQEQEPPQEENTSFRIEPQDSTTFRESEGTSFRNDDIASSYGATDNESGGDTHFKNPMKTETPDLSAIPGLGNAAAVLIRHTRRNQIMLYTLEQNSAQRWLVGRQRDCDIAIEDNAVSRQHGVIQKRGDRWQIDDQQSRNGTYVNDLAVNMTYLSSGDRITFGNIDVIFLPLS
jgi:pSer/pThr/pTyr-binding forkhead associated (FHA) protein